MNKLPSSDLKISIKSFPLSSFKTLSHFLFDKSNSDLKSAKRICSIFFNLLKITFASSEISGSFLSVSFGEKIELLELKFYQS